MPLKSLALSSRSMARMAAFRRFPPFIPRNCFPTQARKFFSVHQRSMSLSVPEMGLYNMGLEGLRTYGRHSVDRDGRFYPCNVYAEPLALYREGGYHPVHLGDRLQDDRYVVVHKLGWGLNGTTWLARDRELSRDVAIKFLLSDRDKDADEGSILRRLNDGPEEHPGKRHIVELLDQFQVSGPNGHHQCLVTEALGPWIGRGLRHEPLSPVHSWQVAGQLVEATRYMHSLNIVHGNIFYQNILLTSSNLVRRHECPPIKSYGICEVETVDGSLNAHAPRYQVEPSYSQYVDDKPPCVKVIDFGKKYVHGVHHGVSIPFHYKAPEVIFDSHFSPSADIFSLGCTIFEIIAAEPPYWNLFCNKDELVDNWIDTFGHLPKEWKSHTPLERVNTPQSGDVSVMDMLQDSIDRLQPGQLWFTKPDLDAFGDLIIFMTQYPPSGRPSASEVLQHPFFQRKPTLVSTPRKIR